MELGSPLIGHGVNVVLIIANGGAPFSGKSYPSGSSAAAGAFGRAFGASQVAVSAAPTGAQHHSAAAFLANGNTSEERRASDRARRRLLGIARFWDALDAAEGFPDRRQQVLSSGSIRKVGGLYGYGCRCGCNSERRYTLRS